MTDTSKLQPKPGKLSASKAARKAVYRQLGRGRDKVREISPPWLSRIGGPVYDYFDMFFIDHGIFRLFYNNRHRIAGEAWRSAQPWPHQLKYMIKKKGVRTVVNLRGDRDCGAYRLEQKVCQRYGVKLDNSLKVYSRAAPSKETVLAIKDYLESLEHPILIHCKSGADRAGLVGVLYQHFIEGVPIEQARHQLSLKYGHFKQAKTGVLDYFFERYLAYAAEHDIGFVEWVETVYDPVQLKADFRARGWANLLVDKVLVRE